MSPQKITLAEILETETQNLEQSERFLEKRREALKQEADLKIKKAA